MTAGDDERPRDASIVRPTGDLTEVAPGAGMFGLRLFLASISMIFIGAIGAYFYVRRKAPGWPPPDAPELPGRLWLSTLALVAVSFFLHRAVQTARKGTGENLMTWLTLASLSVAAFLISQLSSWLYFIRADTTLEKHLFSFTFYMLTGLHALHVIGGVVGIGVLFVRTRMGAYNWAHYGGLRYNAVYWHYLLAVWVVLYGILLLDR